jgi:hypothetical protein
LKLELQPVVVFFGLRSTASLWIEDMAASGSSCSLPVLLDEHRVLYSRFSLRRSRSGEKI